ncbi:stage II sporulation protein M [Oxyplasma meridianum]|uniref:Stage II sporulation protein M n=1 Tax=Oxyplasma meridianum TaxID=3073602 RepID=A0AAX4NFV2_9ARCH
MKDDSFLFSNGSLRFGRIFLILFIIELAIYVAISSLSLHDAALYNNFKAEQSSITRESFIPMFLSIFPHNLLIASIEFVPIVGIFFYFFSVIETSIIISVEGTQLHTAGLAVFFSLALFPHTWLELPSYAIATGASIYIIYTLVKRGDEFNSRMKRIGFLYLFVVLELMVAGLFETSEIVFETTYKAPYNLIYPLILWIPAVPVIIGLIMLFRRIATDGFASKKRKNDSNDPIEATFGKM